MELSFWQFFISWIIIWKSLQSFETCVVANNNLCGKLFSSLDSSTIFNEILKVTSALFFIPDFNLLSCELNHSTVNVLNRVILY